LVGGKKIWERLQQSGQKGINNKQGYGKGKKDVRKGGEKGKTKAK
jgi:hypothetical protein